MLMTDIYSQLRSAFESANVNHDAEFSYDQETLNMAGTVFNQLRIQYSGGNEYLRLDILMKALCDIGNLLLFEYRGRGGQESPRFVAEVKANDHVYQLIYFLSASVT
jgi:hypothetical protein